MKDFKSESAFEKYIRELIDLNITQLDNKIYCLTNKKAVDIVICDDNNIPKLKFIEVKYHVKSHGRLGFGGGLGTGLQPEILLKKPKYFQSNLRFVISAEDIEKIHFLSIDELKAFISGKEVGSKYNNIQTRIFKTNIGLDEGEFIGELKMWLQ